jgi:protein disulfide-isomerase-like protein
MKVGWCLAALGALAGAALAEDVLTLGGGNFTDALKAHDKLVVEFYAPWCGHCKKLAPEYETAAAALKADGIALAKVDATEEENKALSSKFGVRGFPTLKIFRGGDEAALQEYEGPRDAAGIQSYLRMQFGPAVSELADAAALEAAKKPEDGEITVVAVLPGGADSAGYKAYLAAAEALRGEAAFKFTLDAKLEPLANGKDAAFVYKTFDEPAIQFDGTFEKVRAALHHPLAVALVRNVVYASVPASCVPVGVCICITLHVPCLLLFIATECHVLPDYGPLLLPPCTAILRREPRHPATSRMTLSRSSTRPRRRVSSHSTAPRPTASACKRCSRTRRCRS